MMKNWHAAAAATLATLGILGALGFLSPASRAEKAEKAVAEVRVDVEKVKERVAVHDIDIAIMKKDVDFAARALDALLQKEGLVPSPRRVGR